MKTIKQIENQIRLVIVIVTAIFMLCIVFWNTYLPFAWLIMTSVGIWFGMYLHSREVLIDLIQESHDWTERYVDTNFAGIK